MTSLSQLPRMDQPESFLFRVLTEFFVEHAEHCTGERGQECEEIHRYEQQLASALALSLSSASSPDSSSQNSCSGALPFSLAPLSSSPILPHMTEFLRRKMREMKEQLLLRMGESGEGLENCLLSEIFLCQQKRLKEQREECESMLRALGKLGNIQEKALLSISSSLEELRQFRVRNREKDASRLHSAIAQSEVQMEEWNLLSLNVKEEMYDPGSVELLRKIRSMLASEIQTTGETLSKLQATLDDYKKEDMDELAEDFRHTKDQLEKLKELGSYAKSK